MAERAGPMSQPGGKASAPGRLHVVQDFINTRDIEAGTDALDTADELGRWLRRRELLDHGERLHDPAVLDPAHLDPAHLDRAKMLREALRDLCVANHDQQPPPEAAIDTVEAAARTAALTIARDPDAGWRLQPQTVGVNRALGRLVAIVYDAMTTDRWPRLKACSNDTCRWAYWDGSPARTGRWCSMTICGNRAKITAYRDRQGAPRD